MFKSIYDWHKTNRVKNKGIPSSEKFLESAKGVLHIGAHKGQERHLYSLLDLNVIWFEADPETHEQLMRRLKGFDKQRALCFALSDEDSDSMTFHRASNEGGASSLLEFDKHEDMFPHVDMAETIQVRARKLETLINNKEIDITGYDSIVLDIQGAELMALKGMGEFLSNFRFIKAEASDFSSYKDGTQVSELIEFLKSFQFEEVERFEFATKEGLGSYYDVLFERAA